MVAIADCIAYSTRSGILQSAPSLRLVCVCPSNLWLSVLYIVAAGFHTRADAIEAMKQVVAEVTAPSLDEAILPNLPLVPRRG